MNKNEKKIQELILLFQKGRIDQAFDQALSLSKKHPNIQVIFEILGLSAVQLKKFDVAEKAFRKLILLKPDYAQAYYNLGNVLFSMRKFDNAVTAYSEAISKNSGFFDAYMNLGVSLSRLNNLSDAIKVFEKAEKITPENPRPVFEKANMLVKQKKYPQAIENFDKVLKIKPDFIEAYNRKGVTYYHMGNFSDAILNFTKALEYNPDNAGSYFNRAKCHKEYGNLEHAAEDYRKAISIKPAYPEALNNLAVILNEQGYIEQSIEYLEKAIAVDTTYFYALNNLGNFYLLSKNYDKANKSYISAIEANDKNFEGYYYLGESLAEQGKSEQALSSFRLSLDINPDFDKAKLGILSHKRKICDWSDFENDEKSYTTLGINSYPVSPHMLLSMEDHPERQLKRAENFWKNKNIRSVQNVTETDLLKKEKIRVGFFSADVKDHPVMHVSSGLFREYDRSKFEVHLFSFGPPDNSIIRKQVTSDVDVFHDLYKLPDIEIIQRARDQKLCVAIDMAGYTDDARIGLFAQRLAPVQISFLGYQGTLGTDCIDYMIADQNVVGESQKQFYNENIIYLPDTFFPSDDMREISNDPKTRPHHGLPENDFVFCCFNSSYKISPYEFNIWMRVMQKVPQSVLWLPKGNDQVMTNLIHEAEQRQVDGNRLIFAERVPEMRDHLARLQHADLFLDCFNYNAHSTASDALWAGVPLVTRQGEQFSARVASSLLFALGLDELVTKSPQEYEKLILELAQNKVALQKIRKKLDENRKTQSLFNTKKYVRNFERGIKNAFQAHLDNTKNHDIFVSQD